MVEQRDVLREQVEVSINTLHINTLRLMMAALLPKIAQLSNEPVIWLDELRDVVLAAADEVTFAPTASVDPDMMKAGVISALEETFAGARSLAGA
ncbi:MAG: hypothetical protein Q8R81_12005 [Novosphingobium sp.]|uniref:hypothetical protein n=1 Tax=Novosphingobium sp. TaxID=1874826 RepID=UPI002734DA45|nr:hypothetical protein [Novosphingobium sp.]MDP3551104.1 hypothetical protein [Novosphingobium sp.]